MIREKRKKKKRRKIKGIFFLVFLAVIGIGAFVVLEVFTVNKVEVEGNQLYTNEQIKQFMLNDEYSWNSLYVYFKYRFKKPEAVPFIDTMEISLKSPHTIHITVYEKGMLGYLYIPSIDQNAYFDKDGLVVETSSEVISGISKVSGVSCDKVVLYEKLPLEDEKILKTLLMATQSLKKYEVLPDSIEFEKNGDITLEYQNIKVLMGKNDNLLEKIMRLPYILPQLEGMKGILHEENWTSNTTDIIFEKSD